MFNNDEIHKLVYYSLAMPHTHVREFTNCYAAGRYTLIEFTNSACMSSLEITLMWVYVYTDKIHN